MTVVVEPAAECMNARCILCFIHPQSTIRNYTRAWVQYTECIERRTVKCADRAGWLDGGRATKVH